MCARVPRRAASRCLVSSLSLSLPFRTAAAGGDLMGQKEASGAARTATRAGPALGAASRGAAALG